MTDYAYGAWPLVVFNAVLFIVFAATYFRPRTKHDWRALGGFSAFVVALFTEMYGFPLTIYLLTGPLAGVVPGVNFSHSGGHLLNDLVGWKGNPHLSPFHLASYVVIVAGFWLIMAGWRPLYVAQKRGELAVGGPYAYLRHPQYLGFIVVMAGFLLQWPTLVTVVMFPVLVVAYRRLADREERDVRAQFGAAYDAWAAVTPRFVPRMRSLRCSVPEELAAGPRMALARLQGLAGRWRAAAPAGPGAGGRTRSTTTRRARLTARRFPRSSTPGSPPAPPGGPPGAVSARRWSPILADAQGGTTKEGRHRPQRHGRHRRPPRSVLHGARARAGTLVFDPALTDEIDRLNPALTYRRPPPP